MQSDAIELAKMGYAPDRLRIRKKDIDGVIQLLHHVPTYVNILLNHWPEWCIELLYRKPTLIKHLDLNRSTNAKDHFSRYTRMMWNADKYTAYANQIARLDSTRLNQEAIKIQTQIWLYSRKNTYIPKCVDLNTIQDELRILSFSASPEVNIHEIIRTKFQAMATHKCQLVLLENPAWNDIPISMWKLLQPLKDRMLFSHAMMAKQFYQDVIEVRPNAFLYAHGWLRTRTPEDAIEEGSEPQQHMLRIALCQNIPKLRQMYKHHDAFQTFVTRIEQLQPALEMLASPQHRIAVVDALWNAPIARPTPEIHLDLDSF